MTDRSWSISTPAPSSPSGSARHWHVGFTWPPRVFPVRVSNSHLQWQLDWQCDVSWLSLLPFLTSPTPTHPGDFLHLSNELLALKLLCQGLCFRRKPTSETYLLNLYSGFIPKPNLLVCDDLIFVSVITKNVFTLKSHIFSFSRLNP